MAISKGQYLGEKVQPFNPNKVSTVEEALEALGKCSFQGRNLSKGLQIWNQMIEEGEKCLKVLTLSGAMIPAGMGETICCAIEHKLVDVIISTGANITHDLLNALLGESHYLGSSVVDDNDLSKNKINRIYDTLLPENLFEEARRIESQLLLDTFGSVPEVLPPSKVFFELGKRLHNRSMLSVASQYNVPIFCGATSDSDFGLNLAEQRFDGELNLILDEVADITSFADIIRAKEKHGTIIVGGGVPRNWGQQIFPFIRHISEEGLQFGYSYSVRIHTATEYDGGLSGCSLDEGKTWGKYLPNAQHVSIWCDATIAFPLLVTAIIQKIKRKMH